MSESTKAVPRGASTARNPGRTRERLLQAAFQSVHRSGFRGTDLETILAAAGVTKGALYHHFESKESLGYAVVDEVIATYAREKWKRPLESAEDPIDALIDVLRLGGSPTREELSLGCPLNNLAQEMSPLDEGFRTRLAAIFRAWQGGIASALREGQKRGVVRTDVSPDETATFLVAAYEGCWSLAKNSQDVRVMESGVRSLIRYVETLRAPGGGPR